MSKAKGVVAALLAIGVGCPLACARGMTGEGLFGSEESAGGAGGAGGGAGAEGPSVTTGPHQGPSATSTSATGTTVTTGVGPSSSSATSASVAASNVAASSVAAASVVAASSSSGGSNMCCSTSSLPGCIDPGVEQCVCAGDSYCCSTAWDSTCVSEVDSFGCGSCGGGGGTCCMTGIGPGCGDASIESCVCAGDSYCCTDVWDTYCVDEVTSFGCGVCP